MDKLKERKYNIAVFTIGMFLYLINRFAKIRFGIISIDYILQFYFNDFIAGLIFIAYVNFVLSFSKYQRIYKLGQYIFFWIVCSFTWEILAPIFINNSTRDLYDAISYGLGILLYYTISKIKFQKK